MHGSSPGIRRAIRRGGGASTLGSRRDRRTEPPAPRRPPRRPPRGRAGPAPLTQVLGPIGLELQGGNKRGTDGLVMGGWFVQRAVRDPDDGQRERRRRPKSLPAPARPADGRSRCRHDRPGRRGAGADEPGRSRGGPSGGVDCRGRRIVPKRADLSGALTTLRCAPDRLPFSGRNRLWCRPRWRRPGSGLVWHAAPQLGILLQQIRLAQHRS